MNSIQFDITISVEKDASFWVISPETYKKEIFMTLFILAAGMGSRYGGMKQIDPINDDGDFIIDFSQKKCYNRIAKKYNKFVL